MGNMHNSSIDEYILKFPSETQVILLKLQLIIKTVAPKAEEVISYGIPTFKINGKNLVHFAAFKNHIGFYPTPSGIEHYKNELDKYKVSKGSVQFLLKEEIPYNLIKQIVKFRLEESSQLHS